MKKLRSFTLLFFAYLTVNAQAIVPALEFSNPTFYHTSSTPAIKEYGPLSDSLSKAYNQKDFFIIDDTYFGVNSWADYFRWFTHKYQQHFGREQALLYEFYYETKNDVFMARVIADNGFFKRLLGNRVLIDFVGISESLFITDQEMFRSEQEMNGIMNSVKGERARRERLRRGS